MPSASGGHHDRVQFSGCARIESRQTVLSNGSLVQQDGLVAHIARVELALIVQLRISMHLAQAIVHFHTARSVGLVRLEKFQQQLEYGTLARECHKDEDSFD